MMDDKQMRTGTSFSLNQLYQTGTTFSLNQLYQTGTQQAKQPPGLLKTI